MSVISNSDVKLNVSALENKLTKSDSVPMTQNDIPTPLSQGNTNESFVKSDECVTSLAQMTNAGLIKKVSHNFYVIYK